MGTRRGPRPAQGRMRADLPRGMGFVSVAIDETHVEAARGQEVIYHTISSSTLADAHVREAIQ